MLEAKLRPLESLRMSDREIAMNYPSPQIIRAMGRGRAPLPDDPELATLFRRLAERLEARRKDSGGGRGRIGPDLRSLLSPEEVRTLRHGRPAEKVTVLQSMPLVKLSDVLFALPRRIRRQIYPAAPTELRRRMMLATQPQQVIVSDLIEGKLYRAIYSDRQLEEVLTDFWFNHFNVYLNKGAVRQMTTSYERDAIRPYVLGKFGDMLLATAQHPAMLFYLDNWLSADPKAVERIRQRRPNALKNISGINENYGREVLELHTLGVDGGYTQQDVIEVARCFTGWSIDGPRRGGGFKFNWRLHDQRQKEVLGQTIPAGGGIEDGLAVIDLLVEQPATARFISTKLAQRFVADNPPDALIDRMARTFQQTGGDLKEVMRTLLGSPEFYSAGAYRAKVKSPLEFAVSAARATGAEVNYALALGIAIEQMGEPLYRKEEPTGFPAASGSWLNSATLLARINFAQALAVNKLPGATIEAARLGHSVDEIAAALVPEPLSGSTVAAINQGMRELPEYSPIVAALVLGSPEFQRR